MNEADNEGMGTDRKYVKWTTGAVVAVALLAGVVGGGIALAGHQNAQQAIVQRVADPVTTTPTTVPDTTVTTVAPVPTTAPPATPTTSDPVTQTTQSPVQTQITTPESLPVTIPNGCPADTRAWGNAPESAQPGLTWVHASTTAELWCLVPA